MGGLSFWVNEVLFYTALAGSCASAILALLGKTQGMSMRFVSGLPALALLVAGTIPLAARAAWHHEFDDEMDALDRAMLYEGVTPTETSRAVSALTARMRSRYPNVRWRSGAAERGGAARQ